MMPLSNSKEMRPWQKPYNRKTSKMDYRQAVQYSMVGEHGMYRDMEIVKNTRKAVITRQQKLYRYWVRTFYGKSHASNSHHT